MATEVITEDCLNWMRGQPERRFGLVLTSPPYVDARTYGIGFQYRGMGWVDWMIPRVIEMCRLSTGLVLINMAGKVEEFQYSPVVEWLVADLTRCHGIVCDPAPYVFYRNGIPGSGSLHYHRRDWEPVYAFCLPDRLPLAWSDNKATGHPPKFATGGAMSHRNAHGIRKNSHTGREYRAGRTTPSQARRSEGTSGNPGYKLPTIANSGNVIRCKVGGGHMGSRLAAENEAPFPERLAEFFIRSYAPPASWVFDPFCGSGTVLATAVRLRRHAAGIDIRASQTALTRRRLGTVQIELPFQEGRTS